MIGQTVTKVEKAIIKETDGEYKRRGKFVRVFPTFDYNYYKQFFKEERYSNFMIDQRIFGKKRAAISQNALQVVSQSKHNIP